jgi:predicted dehydrogenase
MSAVKYRVAIIGCGSMGQQYAQAYSTYPDTEIVAIAEYNPERRKAVGELFGVKALYPDVEALLKDTVPDIAAVITPSKYFKDAVIACAEAGVKGVSTDKPIAAKLSDADQMVQTCERLGVVYAGGNLMRARHDLQYVAAQIGAGEFGPLSGASILNWGGLEISGGGCQQVSILRLLMQAEVEEVMVWGEPEELVNNNDNDEGQKFHGRFRLTNGIECLLFWVDMTASGVDVWSEDTLIKTLNGKPELFRGFDANGARIPFTQEYPPYEWSEFGYLTSSIRSFLAAVEKGSEMFISGHDLRQALEVAIAAKVSAQRGSVPIKLPLQDRSLTLYPRAYRWEGGDVEGRDSSQLIFAG